jgi:hypothetical protein
MLYDVSVTQIFLVIDLLLCLGNSEVRPTSHDGDQVASFASEH